MKATVSCPPGDVMLGPPSTDGKIHIDVEVDPSGESMPPVIISASGGRLDVYPSRVTRNGDIVIHVFG